MKNFSNQYKTGSGDPGFWQFLLHWLRLLTLSLTRINDLISGIFFHAFDDLRKHKPIVKSPANNQLTDNKKLSNMRPGKRTLKWAFIILLIFSSTLSFGQTPIRGSITPTQSVCVNATEPYVVADVASSTFTWSILSGVSGTDWTLTSTGHNSVDIKWLKAGVYTVQLIEMNGNTCVGNPVTVVVTVNPLPTVTVNSPTVCAGTPATVTATPLPAGTYNYAWTVPATATAPGNVASFTTSVAGTYSVVITNATTGCVSASASGTVTINPLPIVNAPLTLCVGNTATLSPVGGGTWTSSNSAVATVDPTTSVITGVSVGSATFTFASSTTGCSATTASVTVTPKPATTPITHN